MTAATAIRLVHSAARPARAADAVFAAIRLHRSILEKLQDAQEAVEKCEERVILELHGPQPEDIEAWKRPKAEFFGLYIPGWGPFVRTETHVADYVDAVKMKELPANAGKKFRKDLRALLIGEYLEKISTEQARHNAACAKHGLAEAQAAAVALRAQEVEAFKLLRNTPPATWAGYDALVKHCRYISDWRVFEFYHGFEAPDFLKLLSAALKNLKPAR